MSGQAYVGTAKRTFKEAVLHLLESNYGLLGSRRVLNLLADDVQQLVEEFYPPPERVSSGWMIFTATKASGPKPHPGQSAGDHKLVTLACPVLLPEDLWQLAALPTALHSQARQQWFQQRLIRIIEYGWQHPQGPVLFTLADLSAMVGLTTVQVSQLLADARRTTGKPLLTKGYYFDQGMRPSHKEETIALYEAGLDETEIARRLNHDLGSTGKYIRDYERVKLLMKKQMPTGHIGQLLEMQPNVAQAYVEMVYQYHPEMIPDMSSSPA